MVEFAIVLPLLVILLMGIFEFGIAFSRAQSVEAAAREGARLASVSSSDLSAIEARVGEALPGIASGNVTVTPTPSGLCVNRQGETVTIQVDVAHEITIPFVLENHAVNLTGRATFRCEV